MKWQKQLGEDITIWTDMSPKDRARTYTSLKRFITSLLEQQRKISANKYWDAEYRDIRKIHIYSKIENAPEPE